MVNTAGHPLSIKSIKQAIIAKAHQRNKELKKEFYSYDAEAYEFVDINTFRSYRLILFRCPKSKSTVSIKIENIHINQET